MDNQTEDLKCQDCGTTENVEITICPFAHEVHNVALVVNLCQACYHARLQET